MEIPKLSPHLADLIPKIIPVIKTGIKAVESPGGGVAKTEGALVIIQELLKAVLPKNSTAQDVVEILGFARAIIPSMVDVYNAIGIFFKPAPAQPTPEPLPAPAPVPLRSISSIRKDIKKLQDKINTLDPELNKKAIANRQKKIEELRAEIRGLKAA